jgi:hypothetical protein
VAQYGYEGEDEGQCSGGAQAGGYREVAQVHSGRSDRGGPAPTYVAATLVVIRTFPSWALVLEFEWRWPWQSHAEPGSVGAQ